MGKRKKIILKHLLLSLLLLSNTNSYSQELFTKELLWASKDSIEALIFQDKNQINEWGKTQLPFSTVFSKDLSSNGINIYVVLVSGCSGIVCCNIYIFTEKDGFWYLVAKTNARLVEQLMLDVDSNHEKIIFSTKSYQIGELPFEAIFLR